MSEYDSHTWGGTGIAGEVGESAPVVEALEPLLRHLAALGTPPAVTIELSTEDYSRLRREFRRPGRGEPIEFTVYCPAPVTFRRRA